MLLDAQGKGVLANLKVFGKLSGPGWLQSAITLGGGSLAGALFLGVVGGTQLLWVQLASMLMGVVMLSAISYVTLSTGKSPYKMILKDVNPVLALGWLFASLMANMIWVMPQYSLSYSAITQNLAPNLFENPDAASSKWTITMILYALATGMVMCYGSKGKGQKIFDLTVKLIVGAIVICFMAVCFKLVFIDKAVDFASVFSGFIPSLTHFNQPIDTFNNSIQQIADPIAQDFWRTETIDLQQTVLIAAAAFAVGVNMTFMMPFSMLGRGWDKTFRGLAVFDLSTGMVIPFVLATGCVVVASSAAFHGKPIDGALETINGKVVISANAPDKIKKSLEGMIAKRQKVTDSEISNQELQLAAMLLKRDTGSFTKALEGIVGPKVANIIFGLGVLAMGLSTITMLMLICGFCVCELGGFEHGGKAHKLGTLLGTTGILWPVIWGQGSGAFLAVVTGTFGYIFLPVAYIAFFVMFNSKKVMGEHRPTGGKRWTWNILMAISVIFTSWAAFGGAWNKKLGDFYFGRYFVIGFIILAIGGQIYMYLKHKKEALNLNAEPAND